MRRALEGSGRDADPSQRQMLGPSCLVKFTTESKGLLRRSAPNLRHGKQTLVPIQHPRPRHRLRAVGHRLLLVNSDHPFSDLLIDTENMLGSAVVS